MTLKARRLRLEGLVEIIPERHRDGRGCFSEVYNEKLLSDAGIHIKWVQDNVSLSSRVGTVRGLHLQAPPRAQDKLVRCGRGRLFDVAVDIRKGSPTYGQWVGEELSFENGKQLLVPKGFLHGFMTLEPDTEIVYKCSDFYAPEYDGSVRFDDPDLAIAWPLKGDPILSSKDAAAPGMLDFDSPFIYGENS